MKKSIFLLPICLALMVSCNERKTFAELLKEDSSRITEFYQVAYSLDSIANKDFAFQNGMDPKDIIDNELPNFRSNLKDLKFDKKHLPIVFIMSKKLTRFISKDTTDKDYFVFYIGTYKNKARVDRYNDRNKTKRTFAEMENHPTLAFQKVHNPTLPKIDTNLILIPRSKVYDGAIICPPPPGCGP